MPTNLNDFFLLPPVYMAPTIVAFFRRKPQTPLLEIFFVNLIWGWSYLGWGIAALLIFADKRWLRRQSAAHVSQPNAPVEDLGMSYQADRVCGSCGGSKQVRCPTCVGSGGANQQHEHGQYWVPCTTCSGSGNSTCWSCGGQGSY